MRYVSNYHSVLCVVCIILLHTIATAQYQWHKLIGPQTEVGMHCIAVSTTGKYVVAAGRFKTILESEDNGKTFSRTAMSEYGDLRAVAFYSEQGVVTVGDNGDIFRREAFGGNWSKQTISTKGSLLCIGNVGNGILICASSEGEVFRSTDSGIQWNLITRFSSALNTISCSKSGSCLLAGDKGGSYISSDYGVTWETTAGYISPTVTLRKSSYVGDSTWIIAGDTSYVARSTDNGKHWSILSFDSSITFKVFYTLALAFTNNKDGILIGWNNYKPTSFLFATSDGGVTWHSGYGSIPVSPMDFSTVTDLAFPPNNLTGISSGFLDRICTIRIIKDSLPFLFERRGVVSPSAIVSPDRDTTPVAYAPTKDGTFLYTYVQAQPKIINGFYRRYNTLEERSKDGKVLRFWKEDDLHDSLTTRKLGYKKAIKVNDSCMIILADSSNLFLTHRRLRVLQSTDYGTSWHSITPDTTADLTNMLCLNDKEYMIQHWNSTCFYTSDQGNHWLKLAVPDGLKSINLLSVTSSSFIAIGMSVDNISQLMAFTPKKGWHIMLSAIPSGITMQLDKRTLLLSSTRKIYRVSIDEKDSSATITELGTSNYSLTTNDWLAFVGKTIFAVSDKYNIKVSQDSALNFKEVVEDNVLHYVKKYAANGERPIAVFSVGNRLFIGANFGTLLYSDIKDSVSTVVEDIDNLFTNPPYPNPFSHITQIRVAWYPTLSPQNLTLKVYSSLGAEVADLTSQLLSNIKENYSIMSFDAQSLADGIYYVVCSNGKTISTQNLILLH